MAAGLDDADVAGVRNGSLDIKAGDENVETKRTLIVMEALCSGDVVSPVDVVDAVDTEVIAENVDTVDVVKVVDIVDCEDFVDSETAVDSENFVDSEVVWILSML